MGQVQFRAWTGRLRRAQVGRSSSRLKVPRDRHLSAIDSALFTVGLVTAPALDDVSTMVSMIMANWSRRR